MVTNANSRKGRQFADELVHHMIKGEELEIAKIKDRLVFLDFGGTYDGEKDLYFARHT